MRVHRRARCGMRTFEGVTRIGIASGLRLRAREIDERGNVGRIEFCDTPTSYFSSRLAAYARPASASTFFASSASAAS